MEYDEYNQQPVRRSPDMFTVVLTSVITSIIISSGVLWVTGNLPFSSPSENEETEPASVSAGKYSEVPSLIGLNTKSATDLLRSRKLRMVVKSERPDDVFEKGFIVEQEPLAASELTTGEQVSVVVSTGASNATIPEIVGLSLEEAQKLITAAGLKVGKITDTGTGTPGTVTQSTPQQGATVEKNVVISLVVAAAGVAVPKVIGMRTSAAKRKIKEAGFKVGRIRWRYNENKPANLVLSQKPAPGASIPPGSAVNLVLNEE